MVKSDAMKINLHEWKLKLKAIPKNKKIAISVALVLVVVLGASFLVFRLNSQTQQNNANNSASNPIKVDTALFDSFAKQLNELGQNKVEPQPLEKMWWTVYGGFQFSRAIIVPDIQAKRITLESADLPASMRKLQETYTKYMLDRGYEKVDTGYSLDIAQFKNSKTVCQFSALSTRTGMFAKNTTPEKTAIIACAPAESLEKAYKEQDPRLIEMQATNDFIAFDSIDNRDAPYAYYNILKGDGKKVKELVSLSSGKISKIIYTNQPERTTPCVFIDTLSSPTQSNQGLYSDCVADEDLLPEEKQMLYLTMGASFSLALKTDNHRFKISKIAPYRLSGFEVRNTGFHIYRYDADNFHVQVRQSNEDFMWMFHGSGMDTINTITTDKNTLHYALHASGANIDILFWVIPKDGTPYMGNIADWPANHKPTDSADIYHKHLKDFLSIIAQDHDLASQVPDAAPYKNFRDMCVKLNALDTSKGGTGVPCRYF